MPTVKLNGRTEPGLACPAGSVEIVYWSADLTGFGLRCRASGARSWYVQYRNKAGETRKHTLGSPKDVPFARARRKAAELIAAARLGGDPAGEAKQARAAARAAISVGGLVDKYLAHQQPLLRHRNYKETERYLTRHAAPLHREPAARVTQHAIAELLGDVATRGPIAANRMRAALSGAFSWGMKSGLTPANPVAATFRPAVERPRERVLSDHELALIWCCTDGGADYDRITRILLLSGARREEVGGMRWSELTPEEDGTTTWLLPSERTKNRLPHHLVLPQLCSMQLPGWRWGADGERREFVFGVGDGPFSGWSNSKVRLDRAIAKASGGEPIALWRLHDLRRSVVTKISELGVEPHIVEALVNHVGGVAKAGVAGIYNRAAYGTQKRAALALWNDHVARIAGEGGPGDDATNVVPLREAAAR